MAHKLEIIEKLVDDGWIIERPDSVTCSARDVFQKAQQLLQDQRIFSHTTAPSTIEDLLSAIQDAKAKYTSRGSGKAWKWISRLSSKIMFYAEVMDVMVQHHPEYVSLAWGLLKFVFIGVTNHETLIKEVTKALCRICEAVKHVQLNLLLYPTQQMKNLVSDLYTHLVKFAIRAVKWFREPRILHAVTSIARPYALRFKDIVEDIGETIRQVDRLALSMSQVDQRQILLKLDESRRASEDEQRRILLELEATRRELEDTRKTQATEAETSRLILAEIKMAIDGTSQLQFSGLINTNRQLSEIQFSQIMTFLATSNLPSPDLVRHTLSGKRKLRLRLGQDHHHRNPNPPSLYHSPILQTWGASPTSSQILVDGSISKRHVIQDFAIDVIDLVCGADIPIVWVLQSNHVNNSKTNPPEEPIQDFTATDILKYLAWQILKANHCMVDERSASLSARRFQTARTEKEWFALLGAVLEGLQQVYLVVDLDLVDSLLPPGEEEGQSRWWLREFSWFFDRLRERGVKTVVKVLFFRVAATMGGADREATSMVDETTAAHIRVPRRDYYSNTSRVKKVSSRGKRGRNRGKKALAKALRPVICPGTSF